MLIRYHPIYYEILYRFISNCGRFNRNHSLSAHPSIYLAIYLIRLMQINLLQKQNKIYQSKRRQEKLATLPWILPFCNCNSIIIITTKLTHNTDNSRKKAAEKRRITQLPDSFFCLILQQLLFFSCRFFAALKPPILKKS